MELNKKCEKVVQDDSKIIDKTGNNVWTMTENSTLKNETNSEEKCEPLIVTKDPFLGTKIFTVIISIIYYAILVGTYASLTEEFYYFITIVDLLPIIMNTILLVKLNKAQAKGEMIIVGIIALFLGGLLPALLVLFASDKKYLKNKIYIQYKIKMNLYKMNIKKH